MRATPVHPRRRGERAPSALSAAGVAGSSPQARGTGCHQVKQPFLHRFIPAGAGNGGPGSSSPATRTVHPRRRGERIYGLLHDAHEAGSSPQARGTETVPVVDPAQHRFIPAGAGNGIGSTSPAVRRSVHPRRRGERVGNILGSSQNLGSSPQARGTVDDPRGEAGCHRFIPAGAGNGFRRSSFHASVTVHPRRRGERRCFFNVQCPGTGSSPQARGTGTPSQGRRGAFRFIPAGAGNGCMQPLYEIVTPVHPRRRGERLRPADPLRIVLGSSPQARGTAARAGRSRLQARFIPAGAGNGRYGGIIDRRVDGSSPQARGTGHRHRHELREDRFIPAGAGNGSRAARSAVRSSVHPRRRGERSVFR